MDYFIQQLLSVAVKIIVHMFGCTRLLSYETQTPFFK